MLPAVAGVDIDGVLADPTHRLHHLDRRPKDWRAFFRGAKHDPPLPAGIERVRQLVAEAIPVVYVTGRPEWLRADTVRWLADQGLPADVVWLRPRGDFRPAPDLKLDIYRRLSQEYEVSVIIDDDERVVQALRQAGFPVEHATWFTSDDTLRTAQDRTGRT